MKKIFSYSISILAIVFIAGCSNDFELTANWRDTPVVFGFLSQQDTASYIRVEKGFLDEDVSPLELAQRPDSLYYDEVIVTLERIRNTDSTAIESFVLERVDGNLEGYEREDGLFASAPNFLYKLKLAPGENYVPGGLYRLVLNRANDATPVTATTRLVTQPIINSIGNTNEEVKWSRNTTPERVRWSYSIADAAIFDVRIIAYYDEAVNGDINNLVSKQVSWFVAKGITNEDSDNTISKEFLAESFFQNLGIAIDKSSNGPRFFRRFNVVVDAAGPELLDFINIGEANTGLTGASIPPTFSNLSEGFGLFTSRNHNTSNDVVLAAAALDSLRSGIYTQNLNFQ